MTDEQRMRDLDAENIMCRRVNAELREQIQGLFAEIKSLRGENNVAIQSGKHLGAVRRWIKWNFPNGDRVTWGSDQVLGKVTVLQLEELAQRIADEAQLDGEDS